MATFNMIPYNQKQATRRIEEILRKKGSLFVNEISKVEEVRGLPRSVRESIVDELGEEFSAKGLKADGEPNAYGFEIEELTNACGLAWKDKP